MKPSRILPLARLTLLLRLTRYRLAIQVADPGAWGTSSGLWVFLTPGLYNTTSEPKTPRPLF